MIADFPSTAMEGEGNRTDFFKILIAINPDF
jgi:hypothetical protein